MHIYDGDYTTIDRCCLFCMSEQTVERTHFKITT